MKKYSKISYVLLIMLLTSWAAENPNSIPNIVESFTEDDDLYPAPLAYLYPGE